MSWTTDFKSPLKPLHRNHPIDVSPLTVALAAPFLWSIATTLVGGFVTGHAGRPLHPTLYWIVLWSLSGLGLALLPLSLLSLTLDNVRRGSRLRAARALAASADAQERDQEAGRRIKLSEVLSRDLQRLYQEHHQTLVAQITAKLRTDAYGRIDTGAAAAELSYFQEQVVAPALAAKGYPPGLVEERFEGDKEALLRLIVADLPHPRAPLRSADGQSRC